MKPKPTYTTTHPVIFHDATPAMADVISNYTHRPEPPAPGEDLIAWALRSHAGQHALAYIGAPTHAPITLLAAPGEIVNDGAVVLVRDTYAEPLAMVLELRHNGALWLIAINEDGTNACTIDVAGLAATGSEIAAAILEDAADDDAQPLAFNARDIERLAYAIDLVRRLHDRPGADAVLTWLEALQDEVTP